MERLRQTDRAQAWMRRRIWPRNILYDQGEQNLRWDGTSLSWSRKTRDKRLNRQEANLLGVRGDHWVSDLTQGMPSFTGVPENVDLLSRRLAKLGERQMTADWRECNLDLARSLAMRDVWRCGTGFIEDFWDETAGPVFPEYETEKDGGEVRINALGLPVYRRAKDGTRKVSGWRARGAVKSRCVSPLLVYVPLTAEVPLMEACAWVIRLEWATEYQIRQMADEELPDDFSFADDFQFRYTDDFLARIGNGERRQQSSEAMGLHFVAHYYELRKPVEGFQLGKHYIVTSEVSIADEPMQGFGEQQGDRYPLFNFSGRSRARTFWCQPEIQDRVPINRRRNNVLTHEYAYLGRFAMPSVTASKMSEVPEHIPFDGTTIFHSEASLPPQVLQVPPPAPGLFALPEAITKEMDDVGGDYPGSRGVAVSSPSALYLQYVQDAAAKRVGPLVRQHAWSWARLGEHICQLHAKYEPDEAIVATIGKRKRPELVSLRRGDLGAMKFVCNEASLASSLPSARVQQIQTLVPVLFGPPPYPPAMVQAFFDFIRMPDMLELETGSSGLEDFVDEIVCRVVEEAKDPGVDLTELEPEELQAIAQALVSRKYGGDYFDWDEATKTRVRALAAAVKEALQPSEEAKKADEQEAMGKQVDVQNAIEAGKAEAKAGGAIKTAYAKERAKALGTLAAGAGRSQLAAVPPLPEGGGEDAAAGSNAG